MKHVGTLLKRGIGSACYLWLTGTVFILFLLGYLLYGFLWVVRLLQTAKKIRLGAIVTLLIAIVAVAMYYFYFPLPGQHESVSMVIPRGCSAGAIADSLVRHRIVTSRWALLVLLKASGAERRIQAGKCSFVSRSGALAAARALSIVAPLEKTVTVTEGLTIEQTAERIRESLPAVDTAEFIRLCGDVEFIKDLGLSPCTSLEGYLFPDTYSFREAATAADVLRGMVARFNEEYGKLDTAAAAGQHLTRGDIVILASIVEKEAMLAAERPRIAAVFCNRLRLGIPLGADPTVRYIFKKFSGPLYMSELNSASPYNTRVHKGLPPGPICSPGIASLAAAVSPMKTNELYFVAKWDGSGGHEFSLTNAEHVRKKNLIRLKNEQRLRQKEGDTCSR